MPQHWSTETASIDDVLMADLLSLVDLALEESEPSD
jgi:hypothetical protein